jgi:rSAM/selenodomain-associated transferase 2/rSAM/selenodomain-associated transferase 1
MNNMKEKLILFTRYPIPGKAKTRLIPKLGEKGAADLQEIMTGLAVLNARCFSSFTGLDVEIRYEGTSKSNMLNWLGKGIEYNKSGKGDLGQRMHRAFEDAFRSGYNRAVVIGCDCPRIDTDCLSEAFSSLKNNDMVIGPATDGGYYLIGLNKPTPELFTGIDWGTDSVYRKTIAIAQDQELRIAQLAELCDIDTPGDLDLCRDMNLIKSETKNSVSIVIPAINEQENIQQTIEAVSGGALETIVADGGSHDDTVELAQKAGASVFVASCTRAGLLNTAALKTKGDILLFLHADTILPDIYAEAITKAMQNTKGIAGAFSLGIDTKGLGIRFIEKKANFRSRLLKLPYGDQALFMTKNTFMRMGGFADIPIMEDYELVKRLGKKGKVITLPHKVKTSARRWLQIGLIRTTLVNKLMIVGFKVGISPVKLANFYRNQKKRCYETKIERKDI